MFALFGIGLVTALLWVSATRLHADEALVLRRTATPQLLVMNSGRVIRGVLTPRTGGYDVTLPAGRIFVASKQIRFQAESLEAAYRKMRTSFNELTPNNHLELARWCLANELHSEAKAEILDALHLDPYRSDARQMLERLVRSENRSPEPGIADRSTGNVQVPDRRSLGGLPQDLARKFTGHIQPLLANKCGNARCHGADINEFKIMSLRNRVSPTVTETNLAAVLRQIDLRSPERSPLLGATVGSHGNNRTLLFPGRTGRLQVTSLEEWVMAVASELDRSSGITQVSREAVTGEFAERPNELATASHSTVRSESESDQEMLRAAAAAARHDEFDPERFNSRYHGSQAGLQQ